MILTLGCSFLCVWGVLQKVVELQGVLFVCQNIRERDIGKKTPTSSLTIQADSNAASFSCGVLSAYRYSAVR